MKKAFHGPSPLLDIQTRSRLRGCVEPQAVAGAETAAQGQVNRQLAARVQWSGLRLNTHDS